MQYDEGQTEKIGTRTQTTLHRNEGQRTLDVQSSMSSRFFRSCLCLLAATFSLPVLFVVCRLCCLGPRAERTVRICSSRVVRAFLCNAYSAGPNTRKPPAGIVVGSLCRPTDRNSGNTRSGTASNERKRRLSRLSLLWYGHLLHVHSHTVRSHQWDEAEVGNISAAVVWPVGAPV